MLLLFLCGALSILAQVVLLRELVAAFYGVDLIYLLALGAWLLWTAVGALIARRSLAPPTSRVAAVLCAAGLSIAGDLLVIRRLRVLLGGIPGAFLPLPEQIGTSVICLAPPGILLGLLFQMAAKRYLGHEGRGARSDLGGASGDPRRARKRTLARAYAVESVGALVAGFVATWAVHWHVQNLALALAAALVANLTAVGLARSREARFSGSAERDRRWVAASGRAAVVALGGLAAFACTVALAWSRQLDLQTTAWNHPDVVRVSDSPYGRLTLTRRAGQVSVFENDVLSFESEGTDAELLAHLSLLQHPRPRRVLLVSGATTALVGDVVQHRPERIDVVELNPRHLEAMKGALPPEFAQALEAPSVHIAFDDPRRAIAGCRPPGCAYDAIVMAAAEPTSAQANRFFTREFFSLCAARLAAGGVLSLRLASVENAWPRQLIARTGSIYAALRDVFRDVVVLPGTTNIVLASGSPLTRDPGILASRLIERGIRARLLGARYLRYLYSNDRFAEIEFQLRSTAPPANTDANSASYRATALIWLSKFVPSAAQADLSAVSAALGWRSWTAWALLALVAAGMSATVHSRASRRSGDGRAASTLVVAVAAAGAMVVETVLLVHYQLKHGVVFQDLGLLLTSVMAGLALGAWLMDATFDETTGARWRALGETTWLALLAALALAAAASVRTGFGSGLPAVGSMLGATGVAVGAVFARAAGRRPPAEQRALVSPLYAADVAGGSIGSIVASLFLMPLGGLALTAEWAAAICAIAALSVALQTRGGPGTAAGPPHPSTP